MCRFKTFPCVPAKRPCHIRHGRFGGTHGEDLNLHTEALLNPHTHTTTHTHEHHLHESPPLAHKPPTRAMSPILSFQRHSLHTSASMLDSQHTQTHTPHNLNTNTDTTPHHTSVKAGALHTGQAMQLAKNMKTHNSKFWLCNEQHWLQSKMTAVCPRLFEILTTLTFGALRKNHIVSPTVEDITKKHKKYNNETSSSTCGQQCIMKCQEHNRGKKGALREKKSRADVHDGSTRKRRYL